jgi:hypothetical protein
MDASSSELSLTDFTEEQRSAYESYASDPTHEAWDVLSQIYIGLLQVMDGVKRCDPTFPDPYPLAAADIADDFLQWPKLPEPELVLKAMYLLLQDR